ncbi:phytoene synthase 2, chloroplastic isoform X2 [Beta vulgaris subsp. vulgaris]|uniref:phytoene synthase 2, chloroplastic isoform X2 n=1 Tax=Beta vulgaris subsp. vulgaris TaxID=3555 RepID=UPI002036716C|nr:phytoene synthase 2, chloroplastic isoform X2 [Beta vulgaris subsp. vulgaris]
MNNYSLASQLLHLKAARPTAQLPENGRDSSVHRNSKAVKSPRAELLKGKQTNTLVQFDKGIDPLVALHIQQVIEKQSKGLIFRKQTHFDAITLKDAYETCRQICAERSTTYYLAWGQKIDELVDGPTASLATSAVLDSWDERLENIFDGRPEDIVDTALSHAVQQFPLDIQPFKDLIKGMKMDTWKTRYENYEELVLYCYYVAVTGCLMALSIAGIAPESDSSTESIYKAVVSLGIANQLTNILRDVGEDASRGRIYLPQDELKEFGLTNDDIFSSNVTEKWREFTKMQIERARFYYDQGEHIASQLDSSRWPVCASMMLYKKILDKIEENNYDNLTKRARVGNGEKLLTLPLAYGKAKGWCPRTQSSPH